MVSLICENTALYRMTSKTALLLHTHSEVSNHHAITTVDIVAIMNRVSIVFLTIIVLLGTIGNSVVIWVAGFRMKPKVTNIWLVNLAIADLIFCLTRVTSLISSLFFDHWPFGVFLCKFNGFFKYANMFCSVFLLAVISVDRALCICCPVFTRERRTLCAARVVSVGVWIVAVMFSSPYFVYRQVFLKNNLSHCSFKEKGAEETGGSSAKYIYYCIRFICGFLLPFLVILICYILAAVGIRRTRLSGKSRPLRILVVLVCAFFLCWAPYHAVALVKLVDKNNKAVKEGWAMVSNVAYFNSCINPVLYFCMGLDFSQRCNQSLSGIFRRALMEEGQSLSQQGTREEKCNSIPKTADTEYETKV
uniref:G-protein coupled receptors family 1 profile domain-containing protein n=1 Tax=Cyprinus carpio TaxID=7962 RepID=A0A8C1SLD2_CYPCA